MSDMDEGPRARLLDTLDVLSETENVLDIGINRLLSEADVAKASLYAHFGSKDALIAAWLDKRQDEWFGWFDEHLACHATSCEPRAELDAAFGFLETWLARDDFAGCPFVTIYLQLRDPEHPAGRRARSYATRIHDFFHERLLRLEARRPGELAAALLELFLGAIVVEQLVAGVYPARSARRGAKALMDQAIC